MFGLPKSESKGYKVADECLRKGAFVKPSKMLGHIKSQSTVAEIHRLRSPYPKEHVLK
jgi:hypothetical protein